MLPLGLILALVATPASGEDAPIEPPAVTVGPDVARGATVTPAPITSVTVFSDRARITRSGAAPLTAGVHALRLPDLAGATLLDTIRVAADGARVVRVEAVPVQRERFSIDQVTALLDDIEKVDQALGRIARRRAVLQAELSLTSRLNPAPPVPEANRDGRALLRVDVGAWTQTLDFLSARRTDTHGKKRALEIEQRDLSRRRAKLAQDVAKHDLGGFTDQVMEVVVVVESTETATSALTVTYELPGALWKPVYDLSYDAGAAKVTIETAAMVQQATGEDWAAVKLGMSTAVPGRGIEFPELLTWTLGEKDEYTPRPRAARNPPAGPSYGAVTPRQTNWEIDREVERLLLQDRLQRTGSHQPGRAAQAPPSVKLSAAPPPPPPPPPRPAEPSPIVRAEKASRAKEPAADAAVRVDTERVLTLSSGSVSGGGGSDDRGPAYQRTSLDLFEQDGQAPRFADRRLPAVTAGGFDYVYLAPTSASVPSDGNPLRVPLAQQTYPVEVYYEATPALAKVAYLKAKVKNASDRPLLLGPVNIFSGGTYTGSGELTTTGPGGEIEFPLGADEDVRLTRTVIPRTREEGWLCTEDISVFTTTIEVGNFKAKPIRVDVSDVVPKTNNEDVEIELLATQPASTPDKAGILRWSVTVPPSGTTKIEFTVQITRPSDIKLK